MIINNAKHQNIVYINVNGIKLYQLKYFTMVAKLIYKQTEIIWVVRLEIYLLKKVPYRPIKYPIVHAIITGLSIYSANMRNGTADKIE